MRSVMRLSALNDTASLLIAMITSHCNAAIHVQLTHTAKINKMTWFGKLYMNLIAENLTMVML